jgi:hypothetical protein
MSAFFASKKPMEQSLDTSVVCSDCGTDNTVKVS